MSPRTSILSEEFVKACPLFPMTIKLKHKLEIQYGIAKKQQSVMINKKARDIVFKTTDEMYIGIIGIREKNKEVFLFETAEYIPENLVDVYLSVEDRKHVKEN